MAVGTLRWPRVAVLALVVAASACRRHGDPVAETVRSLARAANGRDAPAIAKALTPEFTASNGASRADVERELRQLFAVYGSVDVAISDLATERFPDFALARFRVDFRGLPRMGGLGSLLPASARYRFELRLVPSAGPWAVSSAFWEELP